MAEKIKVITGKIGLDDHFRGIEVVTKALRDAGMEVVYLGIAQRIERMVAAAVQEDADVIGLSFLCGGHVQVMQKLMNQLQEQGMGHVLVVVGGVIPDEDIPTLKELGVGEVFLPGAKTDDIKNYIFTTMNE